VYEKIQKNIFLIRTPSQDFSREEC